MCNDFQFLESTKKHNSSYFFRSGHQTCSMKKGVLRNFTKFTGKHLCRTLFFKPKACNFIKKETPAQMFSCEFCEIFRNTFFTEHLWKTASIFLISFDVSFKVIDSKKLLQFSRLSIYTSLKGLILVSKENHNKAPITTIFSESRL